MQLPSDGSPLNLEWIQMRLDVVTRERTRLITEKKMHNNKMAKNKVGWHCVCVRVCMGYIVLGLCFNVRCPFQRKWSFLNWRSFAISIGSIGNYWWKCGSN